ncbi:MAG TPA: molybdate ABC transporter substrate-binding protein [Gaiellaceae bacterium]|nr:molybdate ABC transporter substrate-binding protein [Gaiellaceae bacterium]
MRRAAVIGAIAAVVMAALPGATSAHPESSGRLTVFAAASLTEVFPAIDPRPRYGFAGSDQLAFQIQQGAPADVFAAASPKYPEALYKQGLVEKPIPFATNTLVLIVPKSNPAGIHSVDDLTKPGVKIVIGDASVPVGSYTRTVLNNLGISAAVMKNVVSQETDVKGVVTKVALGEADAGFVYVTDVKPVRSKVAAIAIRASAQPQVVYEVAVVKSSKSLKAAYAYVTRLIRPPAQKILVQYGFGPRPKP